MQDHIIRGKGRLRRHSFSDDWDNVNDISNDSRSTADALDEEAEIFEKSKQSPEDTEQRNDFDTVRDQSRRTYLEKRSEAKIQQLSDEILEYESKQGNLTLKEKRDYENKLKIYNAIRERNDLKESQQSVYNLPSEYRTEDGRLDRKRKLDLLTASSTKSQDKINKKHNYENRWEDEQMKKAELNPAAADEIVIPNQKNYEFVFDENQYIDFDEDEQLEGEEDDEMPKKARLNDIKSVKESLPVFQYRNEFLKAVSDNQVVVIVGETGSGKTTQLPQYLYEDGYTKSSDGSKSFQIACTQPRRVAATSVAARVADEMNVKLGEEVGYTIRFESNSSDDTVIRYLTDGMLLQEFLTDPELSKYGAIMIDEAHERTLATEILLSLLKDILKSRKDLKLLVASATINAKKFSDFFNNAPIFNIPGRRYPVDIHYTKNPEANYIQAAITTVFQIHTTQDINGAILVFLTGQDEIETMEESLKDAMDMLGESIKPLMICPLYANLPPEMQNSVFEPSPANTRKVVLATNIAETSITIDGIKYVIDSGYVKQNEFNSTTGMESLVVVPCSRASANQRAGRAGRVGPGKCFRLYTKWSFYHELEVNATPEILRTDLTSTILLLLSLGINDLINFEFMDPPSAEGIMRSLELLYSLGALNSKGHLTKLGRKIAEFPVSVMLSKCLISSVKFHVVEEILSIIAMISESANLFYRPKDKREIADKRKESFNNEEGDQLTLLNIWEQWEESGYSNQWCEDNFLQYKTMRRVKAVRQQLESQLKRIEGNGILDNQVSWEEDQKQISIQKAIVSGFFSHVCRLSKMGDSYYKLKKKQTVFVHPSSSLYPIKPPPKLLLYHELVLTSKEYMRNCMIVDDKWVAEFGSHYYNKSELEIIAPKRGVPQSK